MPATARTELSTSQTPRPIDADAGSKTGFWALALGSVGVVYGDIGTSPLYALKESLHAAAGGGMRPTREMVFGVVSLILWALILIVTLKYVLIVMRADNDGEGGTLSLVALAQTRARPARRLRDRPRHGRRQPVLRRRDHHAGDLRAVRRRGPEARDASLRALRRARQPRHPGRAVRRPEPRHGAGGAFFGPDHRVLVPRHGARRPAAICSTTRASWPRFNPRHGIALPR